MIGMHTVAYEDCIFHYNLVMNSYFGLNQGVLSIKFLWKSTTTYTLNLTNSITVFPFHGLVPNNIKKILFWKGNWKDLVLDIIMWFT